MERAAHVRWKETSKMTGQNALILVVVVAVIWTGVLVLLLKKMERDDR